MEEDIIRMNYLTKWDDELQVAKHEMVWQLRIKITIVQQQKIGNKQSTAV